MGAGLPLLQECGQVFRAIVFASQGRGVAFDITLLRGGAAGGRLVEREAQKWRQRVFQCICSMKKQDAASRTSDGGR